MMFFADLKTREGSPSESHADDNAFAEDINAA
jgi:hypothetical protein